MADRRNYLDSVVERVLLCGEGRVGSSIERIVLADGRRLVVKRVIPAENLRLSMTGDDVGREYVAWSRGILDQLPAELSHVVVDGWLDGESAVTVMTDVGPTLIDCTRSLPRSECRAVLAALAAMHRHFLGSAPDGLTPLQLHLSLFSPRRMRLYAGGPDALPADVLDGWGAFEDLVHGDISAAVFGLLDDPGPLASALLSRPCTLIHGDPATSNIALADGSVAMIDWACVAAAPATLDVVRLLAGSASVLEMPREEVLTEYERLAGPAFDMTALRLALLSGLLLHGWSIALAVTRDPREDVRMREWSGLEWWIGHARRTLEAGLV